MNTIESFTSEELLSSEELQLITLEYLLQNFVVGQKRTCKPNLFTKQWVFLYSDKFVLKGLYKEQQHKKIDQVVNRAKYLKEWNCNHVVLPLGIVTTPEGKYIVYPNLFRTSSFDTTHTYTESGGMYTYQILPLLSENDGIIVKSKNYIDSVGPIREEYRYTLLRDLCLLYILDTGDMNLANILVDRSTGVPYIIDIDDNFGTDPNYQLYKRVYPFYFNKVTGPMKEFDKLLKPYYNDVLSSLLDLNIDVLEIIPLSNVYEKLLVKENKVSKEKLKYTHTQLHCLRLNTCLRLLLSENFTYDPPEPIVLTRRSKMTAKGFHYADLVSALQKFVRRGMANEAISVVVELYNFSIYESYTLTNLVSRLCVITVEDIGIANPSLVVNTLRELIKFRTKKNDIKKYPTLERLIHIVELLCESEKTRYMSWIYNAYRYKLDSGSNPIKDQLLTSVDLEIEEYEFNGQKILFNSNNDVLVRYLNNIYLSLFYRKKGVFHWWILFQRIVEENKVKLVEKYNGRQMADMILFKLVKKFNLLDEETVSILEECYYYNSEKRPFMSFMFCCVLFGSSYNLEDLFTESEKRDDIELLLTGNFELVLNPRDHYYVFDKHSRSKLDDEDYHYVSTDEEEYARLDLIKGRSTGKVGGVRQYFVRYGAVVNNEDMSFREGSGGIFREMYLIHDVWG